MSINQNILSVEIRDWKERLQPSFIPMFGNYCILEPFNFEKYGASLFSALKIDNNGESWAYLPYGPCETLNEFQICMKKICAEKDTLFN